jgi:hypothetical protein
MRRDKAKRPSSDLGSVKTEPTTEISLIHEGQKKQKQKTYNIIILILICSAGAE